MRQRRERKEEKKRQMAHQMGRAVLQQQQLAANSSQLPSNHRLPDATVRLENARLVPKDPGELLGPEARTEHLANLD